MLGDGVIFRVFVIGSGVILPGFISRYYSHNFSKIFIEIREDSCERIHISRLQ